MDSHKSAIYWGLGGAVVIIVAVLAWWLWWSYTPYDESDPVVQEKLAMIEELRGDIQESRGFVSAYVQIAHIYGELGDDRRALATYNKLAKLRPKSSPPFISLGQYYRDDGRYALSEKNFLKAVSNDPKNVSVYQDLAFLYAYNMEGREDSFEALILDGIAQYPNIKPNLTQILGFYYKDIENWEKARLYIQQLFELAPERSGDWQSTLDELGD